MEVSKLPARGATTHSTCDDSTVEREGAVVFVCVGGGGAGEGVLPTLMTCSLESRVFVDL